jgi:hypothetical protein
MIDILISAGRIGWPLLGLAFVIVCIGVTIYFAWYHLYKYPYGKKGKK